MDARRIAHRVALGFVSSAGLAGAVAWLYLAVLLPTSARPPDEMSQGGLDEALALAVIAPTGYVLTRRRVERALAARDVLDEPWRLAVSALVFWAVLSIVLVGVNELPVWGETSTIEDHLVNGSGVILAGLVHACVAYLLSERGLRPAVAEALGGDVPSRPPPVALQRRFLLAWGLGSGVPLVAIALSLVGRTTDERADLGPALWFLVAVGLLSGGLIVAAVARSVAEPLERLRTAMARARDGDLAVSLPVDDAGEVGFLQAGFNAMVAGLRERERLRDVFGRHVGVEVAKRALEGDVVLGGEQREASVLFVDLVGSTTLAEGRPPEAVVEILNRFFAAVVEVVSDEGGWVNKFQGDAALCVFGAPDYQSDHAARALRAAVVIAACVSDLGVDAGVGVSSGTVVAGNVGSRDRFEYTVIGDPVNEAARLTEEAKRHAQRVLASDRVVTAAGTDGWHKVASMDLRGRSQPTDVYVPGVNPSRAR